jgi:integrase
LSVRKREWTTAKGEHKEAWQVAYTDSTGKRRTETFAFQKDAKDRHAEVAVEIKKGTHTPKSASPTVAEAGDKWLTACTAEGLERTTVAEYARQLNLHASKRMWLPPVVVLPSRGDAGEIADVRGVFSR